MQIDIILKNYRCFSDSKPAEFSLQNGFTSFVGANNSGKSTILKFFYEFRDVFNILSKETNIGHLNNALQGNFPNFEKPHSVMDPEELFCDTNDRDIEICFKLRNSENSNSIPLLSRIDINIPRSTYTYGVKLYSHEGYLDLNEGSLTYSGGKLLLANKPVIDLSDFFQIFEDLTNTLYVGAFRNIINVGPSEENAKYFDINVGKSFVRDWRNFKTGNTKKENEYAYKVIRDIKHIFEFTDLDINSSASVDTLKLFINGKSYNLSEVGSGIAQFIIVLANAAMKNPSYILIDEPELNLHPSLQLDFLTALGSYAHKGTLFATHSIGLARSISDKIYSVRKIDEKSILSEFEATQHLSEFLGELNFSGYRELGFDKILLVEGPTDVKTIQQFLRLIGKDHQIVLLPLSGKSLINNSSEAQLEEIKRISNNIFALIDSERSSSETPLESKRAEFVEICKKIGIQIHVLNRRAIENYLTDEAIKKIKGDKYEALDQYQLPKETSHTWPKSENWRIAREMTLEDLEKTDLGLFLKSI